MTSKTVCADNVEWSPISILEPVEGMKIMGYGKCKGAGKRPDVRSIMAEVEWAVDRTRFPGYNWRVIAADCYEVWMRPSYWCILKPPVIRMKAFENRYLGDHVYASFDGYRVMLGLRHQELTPMDHIYLEPEVFLQLVKYEKDAREHQRLQSKEVT